MKYEDLCNNPKFQISRVCEFLSIKYEPAMLNFRVKKGHTVMGNRMRFKEDKEIIEDLEWRKKLSSKEKELFSSNFELIKLYRHFGYELA